MKILTRFSSALLVILGLVPSLLGCSQQPTAESAPTGSQQEPVTAGEPAELHPEDSADPSALRLVEALAAQIASRWKTEQAIADEVALFVRFRLDGKSAAVLTNASGAQVITGSDAVTTHADVTVDVTREDADAIAEGGATIFTAKEAGTLKVDSPDGFDRFLSYVDKD